MICECEDWKQNMVLIDEATRKAGGYAGKFMSHCPWCGLKLTAFMDLEPGQMMVVLNRKHFGNE